MNNTEKQMNDIKNLLLDMKKTAKKISKIDIDKRFYQGYSTATEDVCDSILELLSKSIGNDEGQRL